MLRTFAWNSSEYIVVASGSLGVAKFEYYLRALSEFFDSEHLHVGGLNFWEDIEVGVEVLSIVLLDEDAKFF